MTDNPCQVNDSPDVSDNLTDQYAARMQRIGNSLVNGNLTIDQFHATMQDAIRMDLLHQAIAGTSGADERQLTPADRARLEAAIGQQYDYLDGFVSDIESAVKDGGSLNFVSSRAASYAGAGKIQFWDQNVGNIDLPTMPGEQQCLGNCGCGWELECVYDANGKQTGVNAYWRRNKNDSCEDCVNNEAKYNPLYIALGG